MADGCAGAGWVRKGVCRPGHRQVVGPIAVEENAVLWVDMHVHPGAVLRTGGEGLHSQLFAVSDGQSYLVRRGEGELVVSDGGAKARRDAGETVEQPNLPRVMANMSTHTRTSTPHPHRVVLEDQACRACGVADRR